MTSFFFVYLHFRHFIKYIILNFICIHIPKSNHIHAWYVPKVFVEILIWKNMYGMSMSVIQISEETIILKSFIFLSFFFLYVCLRNKTISIFCVCINRNHILSTRDEWNKVVYRPRNRMILFFCLTGKFICSDACFSLIVKGSPPARSISVYFTFKRKKIG
jgi:hypothetical protein